MDNHNNYYEPHVNFDFESIYSKEEQPEEYNYPTESIILEAILEFLAPKRFKKNATLCRCYALIFILKPWFFGKPNITQVEVAEILGVSKQIFNQHVGEFRKKFGFHINGMRNEEAREKFSKITAARADELSEARRRASKARAKKAA